MAVAPESFKAAFRMAYAPGASPKDAALALAGCGISVFPQIKTDDGRKYPADAWQYGFGQDFVLDGNGEKVIDPATRRPKRHPGTGGPHKATTDAERIAGAWKQFPKAIVGVVLPAGYVVLDLDRHGNANADGVATFEALQGQNGQNVRTLATLTPRGGRHLYFRLEPPQELPKASELEGLAGIEVFPSGYQISEGAGYSLLDDAEPALMPRWLYTALRLALPKKQTASASSPPTIETGQLFGDGQRLVKVPASAYERELADILKTLQRAEEGTRNNALLEAARRCGWCVAEGGISEEHARDRLTDEALSFGLDSSEILSTIRSGFAWAAKNPRVSPRLPAHSPDMGEASQSAYSILEAIDQYAPGTGVYEGTPPPLDYCIAPLIERGDVACAAGPGGVGKSLLYMQAVIAKATGTPWLGVYETGDPGESWFLSIEDSERNMHRRNNACMDVLPNEKLRKLATKNARFIPLEGEGTLFKKNTSTGKVEYDTGWSFFARAIRERKPSLVVLDPFSAITYIDTKDNEAMAQCIHKLANLMQETNTTFIYLHHVLKKPTIISDKKELDDIMTASSILGGGQIVNAARHASLTYPLSVNLATKLVQTNGKPIQFDGEVIAFKEVKKNGGKLEKRRYFRHTGNYGLLEPCEAIELFENASEKKEIRIAEQLQELEENARLLAREAVKREQNKNTLRITVSYIVERLGIGGHNAEKSNSIAQCAQDMGLIHIIKRNETIKSGFGRGSSGNSNDVVPSIQALELFGHQEPKRPGEYCGISPEHLAWLSSLSGKRAPKA